MGKALKNAIAVLIKNGTSPDEIRQLVEDNLQITFVSWENIRDHLDDLVDLMPGWVVSDREKNIIQNQEGQKVWFGLAVNGGTTVHQYNHTFVKGIWGPPGFTTRRRAPHDALVPFQPGGRVLRGRVP